MNDKRRKGEADREICIIVVKRSACGIYCHTYFGEHDDGLWRDKVIHEYALYVDYVVWKRSCKPQRDIGVPAYLCHACMHTSQYAVYTLHIDGMLRFRRTCMIIRCAYVSPTADYVSPIPIIIPHRDSFFTIRTRQQLYLRLLGLFRHCKTNPYQQTSNVWDTVFKFLILYTCWYSFDSLAWKFWNSMQAMYTTANSNSIAPPPIAYQYTNALLLMQRRVQLIDCDQSIDSCMKMVACCWLVSCQH